MNYPILETFLIYFFYGSNTNIMGTEPQSPTKEELDQFNEHIYGKPKNRWISTICTWVGELPAILSYGASYITKYLDAEAQRQPDYIITKPLLRVKEILTTLGFIFMSGAIFNTLYLSKWNSIITLSCLIVSYLSFYKAYKTTNPVIAVVNGPSQEVVSYLASSRTPNSRLTFDGFKKLFNIENARTTDVLFIVQPELGRHAVNAGALRKYLSDDTYLYRTFKCAYTRFSKLFEEWADDPIPRSVSAHMNLVALSILADSILGFKDTSWEILDMIEEIEHALSSETPYWELPFGIKLALTPSQRRFLRTRQHFTEVASRFLNQNRDFVLQNPDNFTIDLATQVALLHGPDAKSQVAQYLDHFEVQYGTLATMLAFGNPATTCAGTLYIVKDYPTETRKLLEILNVIRQQTITMSPEETLRHYYTSTKSPNRPLTNYFQEAVRYTAPANTVARYVPSTITMNGHNIPTGSILITNVRTQCHNPKLWEDPRIFNPDRFIDGKYSIHRWPYIPFSVGERGCPGVMSMRSIFFGLLLAFVGKYELIPDDSRPAFIIPDGRDIARASRIHTARLKRISMSTDST